MIRRFTLLGKQAFSTLKFQVELIAALVERDVEVSTLRGIKAARTISWRVVTG